MEGYGVVTSSLIWKKDAYETLYVWAYRDEDLKQQINDYYQTNKDDYASVEASFYDFVENWYENDTYLWHGIEGFVTDLINLFEYNGDPVFRYEDCCIYVPAYVPLNRNSLIITQEDVDGIVDKYLSPLVDGPVSADWQTIQEN